MTGRHGDRRERDEPPAAAGLSWQGCPCPYSTRTDRRRVSPGARALASQFAVDSRALWGAMAHVHAWRADGAREEAAAAAVWCGSAAGAPSGPGARRRRSPARRPCTCETMVHTARSLERHRSIAGHSIAAVRARFCVLKQSSLWATINSTAGGKGTAMRCPETTPSQASRERIAGAQGAAGGAFAWRGTRAGVGGRRQTEAGHARMAGWAAGGCGCGCVARRVRQGAGVGLDARRRAEGEGTAAAGVLRTPVRHGRVCGRASRRRLCALCFGVPHAKQVPCSHPSADGPKNVSPTAESS